MSLPKLTRNFIDRNRGLFTPASLAAVLLGTAISTFAYYNIHQRTGITEGGIVDLVLLLHHWTGLPLSLFSLPLDLLCYGLAFRHLGRGFIQISVVAAFFRTCFFRLLEQFPPTLPDLTDAPLAAAVLGAVLIGVGTGLVLRGGGSGSGDDALALTISKVTRCRISYAYLLTDLTVLALSLTYIPLRRIGYSLITVTISSVLVDVVHRMGRLGQERADTPAEDTP